MAERQPHMRLAGCGSSRARTIRSLSPCRPTHPLLPHPLSCSVVSIALGATRYEPVAVLPPSSPPGRTLCSRLAPWRHVLHPRWPWTCSRHPSTAPLCVVTSRHVDPHGMTHGKVLVRIREWYVCRWYCGRQSNCQYISCSASDMSIYLLCPAFPSLLLVCAWCVFGVCNGPRCCFSSQVFSRLLGVCTFTFLLSCVRGRPVPVRACVVWLHDMCAVRLHDLCPVWLYLGYTSGYTTRVVL